MASQMDATQVIRLWQSAHNVNLTELAHEKLMAAVNLICEGCYSAGKKAAYEEVLDSEEEQATRDSVHGSDSAA